MKKYRMDKLGPYLLGPNATPENGIYTGDARELARAIPDESVDLIFTDPVYQNIDDYRWLAECGKRVLEQGGNCLAQYGHHWQIQVLNAMNEFLDFVSPLTELQQGGHYLLCAPRVIIKTKMYAWFSNGNKRIGGWTFDIMRGGGTAKRRHKWEDSISPMFLALVERLVERNGIVLDFFTGCGTIPAICKMIGRRYLAFEIESETAEMARERVRMTQPPLFVLEHEQLELL